MRDRLAWLLTAPLMVAGSLAGHELGYRATVPKAHAREHALAASGHGYLSYWPLAAGVAGALAGVLFLLLVVRAASGARTGSPPGLFAALPPLAFVLQEHLERFVRHGGEFPWTAALEASFVAGLLFQLPFALAALVVAHSVARFATRIGRALRAGRLRRPRLSRPSFPVPEAVALPPLPALAGGSSERGPPLRV
jgi:hypothetical protein